MPLSGKQIVKLLKNDGWKLDRISGSHYIMAKGVKTISIPVHGNKSLKKGIESKILKQAGLTR